VPLYNVACSTLWPQTSNFLKLNNPKATLENKLRGFSALTTGDTIVIRHASKQYALDIMEVKPGEAMTIIETDVNVDFAPPLDHEEGLAGAAAQAQKAETEAAAAAAAAPAAAAEDMEEDGGDKFAAFGGNGFSLSGKNAPSTGNGIIHTFGKIEKPIDMLKGGQVDAAEHFAAGEQVDSSDEETPMSYEGKRFHAFGGTGWR